MVLFCLFYVIPEVHRNSSSSVYTILKLGFFLNNAISVAVWKKKPEQQLIQTATTPFMIHYMKKNYTRYADVYHDNIHQH